MSDVEAKVIAIVSNLIGVSASRVTLDSSLLKLNVDSLDQIEIIMAVEDAFDIEIADEAAEEIKTVRELVDLVKLSLP